MKMEMEIVKRNEKLISPTDTIAQTQTQTRYSYKGGSTWGSRLFVTIHVDNRNQLYDCVLHNLLGLSSCSTSCWYNGAWAWALAQSLSLNKNNVTYCDRERERKKERPPRPTDVNHYASSFGQRAGRTSLSFSFVSLASLIVFYLCFFCFSCRFSVTVVGPWLHVASMWIWWGSPCI